MKIIRSFHWEKTNEQDYKTVLGCDSYAIIWKISLTLDDHHYFFCPGCGESDVVSILQDNENTIYVYSENASLGYASARKYYLNEGQIIEADYECSIQSTYDFFGIVGGELDTVYDRFFDYDTILKCKLLTKADYYDDSFLLSDVGVYRSLVFKS